MTGDSIRNSCEVYLRLYKYLNFEFSNIIVVLILWQTYKQMSENIRINKFDTKEFILTIWHGRMYKQIWHKGMSESIHVENLIPNSCPIYSSMYVYSKVCEKFSGSLWQSLKDCLSKPIDIFTHHTDALVLQFCSYSKNLFEPSNPGRLVTCLQECTIQTKFECVKKPFAH